MQQNNLQKTYNVQTSYRLLTMGVNFCERLRTVVLVFAVKLPLALALCVSLCHRRGTTCSMWQELRPLRPCLPYLGDYTVEAICWQCFILLLSHSHRQGLEIANIIESRYRVTAAVVNLPGLLPEHEHWDAGRDAAEEAQ